MEMLGGEEVPYLVYLGEREMVEGTQLEQLWAEDKLKYRNHFFYYRKSILKSSQFGKFLEDKISLKTSVRKSEKANSYFEQFEIPEFKPVLQNMKQSKICHVHHQYQCRLPGTLP